MHIAFENAGKSSGLEIWRIENFQPVPYPKNDYGKFYTGDSYIVLFTDQLKSGKFNWDIHFWLGTKTTQDESGAAAILSVDLDDQLGGAPVQYREVQEHESQKFLALFKSGLRYLPGGIQSGFQHFEKSNEKRLFQVKGAKNIRVKQVDLSVKAMNKGDCFIIDAGDNIIVYVGAKSKRMERLKAIQAANQIRDQDHAGRSKIQIADESDRSALDEFFKLLGSGSPSEIPDAEAGGDDMEFENNDAHVVTLYRVSDSSGNMKMDKVGTKPLTQNLLDSNVSGGNDCFILDTEKANIFVWIGKSCTKDEKREAMNRGQAFLKSKNYPVWTKVQRVIDGGEPTAFKQYFESWKDASGDVGHVGQAKLIHVKIHDNGKLSAETLTEFDQEDLDEDDVMVLDTGSQVFLWVGKDGCDDEKAESMKIARKCVKEAEYKNNIDVVYQGEEPAAFTKVFSKWNAKYWATAPTIEERINHLLH